MPNKPCRFCGRGELELKSRIRDIPYQDTILNVQERLYECSWCKTQPSTTRLMQEHREAIALAKNHYDKNTQLLS